MQHTEQDPHQGGLAGAIRAEQADHRARGYIEVDVLEHDPSTEAMRDPARAQHVFHHVCIDPAVQSANVALATLPPGDHPSHPRGYGWSVPAGDHVDVELAGRTVRVTSPDKVMFPAHGTTKLDVVRYYEAVEEPLMRAMGRRPVLMERFPRGVGAKSFFQKRVPDDAPDWLETTIVSTPNGTTSRALVAADVAHVAWAVNLGCLGFHVWPNTADDPDHADELRIDLDPQPGVGFDEARGAAREVRTFLDELGIESRPKTTGNRGIHVYVRLERRWSPIEVRAAAVATARELARRHPETITDAWWKEERGERIFVDFNQNAPHKTVFGAWSVRARPDGQVSTPFSWEQLDTIDPEALTLRTVPAYIATHGDPWDQIEQRPQSLQPLLEMSERDLASGLSDAPWPPVYPKMPGEPPRVAPSRAKKVPKQAS